LLHQVILIQQLIPFNEKLVLLATCVIKIAPLVNERKAHMAKPERGVIQFVSLGL
jgi:hypothetical protein